VQSEILTLSQELLDSETFKLVSGLAEGEHAPGFDTPHIMRVSIILEGDHVEELVGFYGTSIWENLWHSAVSRVVGRYYNRTRKLSQKALHDKIQSKLNEIFANPQRFGLKIANVSSTASEGEVTIWIKSKTPGQG